MNTKNKIALFFDCENISIEYLDTIYQKLKQEGEVIISKGYANWNNNHNKKWRDKLTSYAIEQIHPNTSNKNASDIKITIDVMKTICDKKANTIALVTSDSDFTCLAIEIKSQGYQVLGIGEEKAPKPLRHAYSKFIELKHKKSINKDNIIQTLKEAIEKNKNKDGYVEISILGTYLQNKYKLNAKKFEFDTWGGLINKYYNHFETTYQDDKKRIKLVKIK